MKRQARQKESRGQFRLRRCHCDADVRWYGLVTERSGSPHRMPNKYSMHRGINGRRGCLIGDLEVDDLVLKPGRKTDVR